MPVGIYGCKKTAAHKGPPYDAEPHKGAPYDQRMTCNGLS